MALLEAPPIYEPMAERVAPTAGAGTGALLVTQRWVQWLGAFRDRVNEAPARHAVARLPAQAAAIATTPFPIGTLAPGLYRVSYTARIRRPATTSSRLTVTVSWTDGVVACRQSGAALTGNTTATVQAGTLLVRIDPATPIAYATAYQSVGGTPMQYDLHLVVEAVALETV